MDRRRLESRTVLTTVSLRAAGIVLGLILLLTLIVLIRTSLNGDRGAVLSQTAMQWSRPAIIAAFVLWTAGVVVLLKGRWPVGGDMLTDLKSAAMVTAVWILATTAAALRINLIIICSAAVIAYVVLGAVMSSAEGILLVSPITTFGVSIITFFWYVLGLDPATAGALGKPDTEMFFYTVVGIVIGPVLAVISIVLMMIGAILGDAIDWLLGG
jgi:hypothetical protein